MSAGPSAGSPAAFSGGPLAGLFAGAVSVPAPPDGFVPGAYADHMTSYAAAFDRPSQMKATEWLKRGAAFTSGTVAEPLAVWKKFPSATLEALFLATACPLQLQPLGDPLCAPWAPRIEPVIEDGGPTAAGGRSFRAALAGGGKIPVSWRCTWLLDGVKAGGASSFAVAPGSAAKTLRLVVRDDFRVRHQGWTETAL